MADVDIAPNFGLELKVGQLYPRTTSNFLSHETNGFSYRMDSKPSTPGSRMASCGWMISSNSTGSEV